MKLIGEKANLTKNKLYTLPLFIETKSCCLQEHKIAGTNFQRTDTWKSSDGIWRSNCWELHSRDSWTVLLGRVQAEQGYSLPSLENALSATLGLHPASSWFRRTLAFPAQKGGMVLLTVQGNAPGHEHLWNLNYWNLNYFSIYDVPGILNMVPIQIGLRTFSHIYQ